MKALILDLGGVVVDIDIEAFFSALKAVDNSADRNFFTIDKQNTLCHDFETGKLTEKAFLEGFANTSTANTPKDTLKKVWCQMIKGITKETLDTIKLLRKQRKLFALSNTNIIHADFINQHLQEKHAITSLNDLFDDVYLSYESGFRKPDTASFHTAINKFNLAAKDAIFIDDIQENLEAAKTIGLETRLKKREETLKQFLLKEKLIT